MTFGLWFSFSELVIQLEQNGTIASSFSILLPQFNKVLFAPFRCQPGWDNGAVLSTVALQQECSGFEHTSRWLLCGACMFTQILPRCFCFLPQSKANRCKCECEWLLDPVLGLVTWPRGILSSSLLLNKQYRKWMDGWMPNHSIKTLSDWPMLFCCTN